MKRQREPDAMINDDRPRKWVVQKRTANGCPSVMEPKDGQGGLGRWRWWAICVLGVLLMPGRAEASMFQGEALDKVADAMTWVVLVVVPVVAVAVFWLVHILPEKVAEKRHHPQAKAIQCLCLLSLAFGGLLWPLAWLWAYSKPVLYKMAYGTDVAEEPGHGKAEATEQEVERLRLRLAGLEAELAAKAAGTDGGKA